MIHVLIFLLCFGWYIQLDLTDELVRSDDPIFRYLPYLQFRDPIPQYQQSYTLYYQRPQCRQRIYLPVPRMPDDKPIENDNDEPKELRIDEAYRMLGLTFHGAIDTVQAMVKGFGNVLAGSSS